MPIRVIPYHAALAPAWNAFVATSRNGTFLFDRAYMDYHADRFQDASLLFERGGETIALFPANRSGDSLASHGGLTYGGLVLAPGVGLERVQALVEALCEHAAADGCKTILYKTIPSIYHRAPAEEDRWALHRAGADLIRSDPLAVVPVNRPEIPRARAKDMRKAARTADAVVGPSTDWAGFWAVLEARLGERHGVRPVHSLAEILSLAACFPDQISLRTATVDGRVVAGAVNFAMATVVHCQYSAGNDLARETRLLDLVYETSILAAHARGLPFDFGTSMENGGATLNAGLQLYKESYGARCVLHDYYQITL